MKKLVIEEENEGLLSLLGEKVLIMTSGYFYQGKLEGVNDTCIKLKDPSIVYETGKFSDENYGNIESLDKAFWYIQNNTIESFGLSK